MITPEPQRIVSISAGGALPIFPLKVAIPPAPPTLVARPRLTALLNHARTRLILVAAPAGSGKSSLVSQWCHEHAWGHVAWLSLDAQDDDSSRFLQLVCAALEPVAPNAVRPASTVLSQDPGATDRALTRLLDGLAELDEPVVLVVDDYHFIETPRVHTLTASLLERSTLRLVLVTRADPPLPLARLRARNELVELRSHHLRFTDVEASSFLNERMGLALSASAVHQLTDRTEGWIAGLQLAALSLQGHLEPERFIATFGGRHRDVGDYLVEEVLDRQPEDVRIFLRRTAILEQLCGPLCEAVMDGAEGQAMLERLEAANLFLIPLDEERRWYRYHHLFAELLRTQSRARGGERQANEEVVLHGRAADWYEAEGMVAEAIGHALAAENFHQAHRLIDRLFEATGLDSEPPELGLWMGAATASLLRARPLLSLALALACLAHLRVDEVEKVLSPGLSGPEQPTWRSGRLALLGAAARLRGDETAAETRSREALALPSHDNSFWRPLASRTLGRVFADRGDLQEALAVLAQARAEAEKLDNPMPFLLACHAEGSVLESRGGLHQTEQLCQQALALIERKGGITLAASATLFAVMGRLRFERNDLAAAQTCLEEALRRSGPRAAGTSATHGFIGAYEMLRLRTALGEHDGTLMRSLDAAAHGAAARFFEPVVAALRVAQADAFSETVGAWLSEFEVRTADGSLPARPMPDTCPIDVTVLEILTWARLRCARGETQVAMTGLEQFLTHLIDQGRLGSAVPVRALLATLVAAAGRVEVAVSLLQPALVLAEREGYLRAFLEVGDGIAPVLRTCVARGIASQTAEKVLAALSGLGDPGEALPKRAGPLSERELEVLRLAASGLTNAQIAERLFLAEGTVKRHLFNVFGKLDAANRTSAVARARALGLV